jgi:hypothetical protein
MKLSYRIRAYMLKREADALLRRARRPHKQSVHMIGPSSWTLNPETVVLAAVALAAFVLINFVPL